MTGRGTRHDLGFFFLEQKKKQNNFSGSLGWCLVVMSSHLEALLEDAVGLVDDKHLEVAVHEALGVL